MFKRIQLDNPKGFAQEPTIRYDENAVTSIIEKVVAAWDLWGNKDSVPTQILATIQGLGLFNREGLVAFGGLKRVDEKLKQEPQGPTRLVIAEVLRQLEFDLQNQESHNR